MSEQQSTAAKKIRMYMGLPSTGTREDAQNYTLRFLEKKYGDRIEFVYPEMYVGRIFHDHARNKYMEQFLQSQCDVMWFLDSDIVPPHNVLDLITDHWDKWYLAGAPYPVWMTIPGYDGQQVTFCVYRKSDKDDTRMHPSRVPSDGGLDYVDGIATGCIFIKKHVAEKLSTPYFEFKYDTKTRDIVEGEDLGFCMKVSKLGYQFFIDFSMLCHHYKKVSLLDVNNYVQVQINQTIDVCDRSIRQILAKKQMELHAKRQLQSKLATTPTEKKPSRIILPD